jgi:DNA mismatch endonuclease (patch repair protein)
MHSEPVRPSLKQKAPAPLDEATSRRLSRQRTTGTAPEDQLVAELAKFGFRIERNVNGLPGTPDLYLPRSRTVIFVNGCFWHGCPKHFRCPRNNRRWWLEKIERNRTRDQRTRSQLRRKGFSVLTVWEHEDPAGAAGRIRVRVRSGTSRTR